MSKGLEGGLPIDYKTKNNANKNDDMYSLVGSRPATNRPMFYLDAERTGSPAFYMFGRTCATSELMQ